MPEPRRRKGEDPLSMVQVQLWDGTKYCPKKIRGEAFQGFSVHRSQVPGSNLVIVSNQFGASVRRGFRNFAEARSFVRLLKKEMPEKDFTFLLGANGTAGKRIGNIVKAAEKLIKAKRKLP